MSYDAQAWARKIKTGSPTLKAVLMNLANRANDEHGSCWPSQQLIADETEYDVRTVRKSLSILEDMDLIRREKRYDKTDMIYLLMPTPDGVRAPERHSGRAKSTTKHDRNGIPGVPDADSGDQRYENPGVEERESGGDRNEIPTNLQSETSFNHQRETKAKTRKTSPWPDDYREQFWSLYPKKPGDSRKNALDKLERIERSDKVEFSELMTGLKYYAARMDREVKKDQGNKKFIAAALVWLNGAKWETEEPVTALDKHASIKARVKVAI